MAGFRRTQEKGETWDRINYNCGTLMGRTKRWIESPLRICQKDEALKTSRAPIQSKVHLRLARSLLWTCQIQGAVKMWIAQVQSNDHCRKFEQATQMCQRQRVKRTARDPIEPKYHLLMLGRSLRISILHEMHAGIIVVVQTKTASHLSRAQYIEPPRLERTLTPYTSVPGSFPCKESALDLPLAYHNGNHLRLAKHARKRFSPTLPHKLISISHPLG